MPKSAARRSRSAVPARPLTKFGQADVFIAVGLAIVTFAIYARVVGHQFIGLDDDLYIRDNPMVNRGLSFAGIIWAFTTFHAANWHPLTWIAHMIDIQLFGLNAGRHLLVNVSIHIATTLLLFWFFLRTTRDRWCSALVAALFAFHPVHVESVAWAAERKDTLATLFGLLSLIAYSRYAEAPSRSRYAWTALTLALGLLAKPMLMTWPLVMLLLDYWPLRRLPTPASGRNFFGSLVPLVREKLLLFGIVAASAVITYIAQTHGGAVRTFVDAPVSLRLSNALVSYAKYLFVTFWPANLAVYYPFPPEGIPAWQIIGAVIALAGITVFCFLQAKSRPYLIVGWLWFVGTLVPVIGIVQVGGQTMADRYHYLPSIGLFVAIVFGLADVIRARNFPSTVVAILAGAPLIALAALTMVQVNYWRDSITLFRHTLGVTPPSLIIEHNLGLVLGQKGNYDEAGAHFEKALQIKPDFFDALLNIGITRSKQNRMGEAIDYYERALRAQPGSAKAHMELGLALARENRNDAASEQLQLAAHVAPDDADMRTNLGLVLVRLGKFPEGIDQLHQALRLDPDNAEAHNNLGLALLVSGKTRESIPEFEKALQLKPALHVAGDNLRRAQAKLQREK